MMADAKGAYIGGVPVQFKDEKARAMISNEYVPAESYVVGNLCIRDGKLYKAIKATTGTWDVTAWAETNLVEVNAGMQKSITDLTEKYPLMATWGGQFAYDDSVISSPAWARCIKYANGKCDIHIDTMIETNKATGNFYKIWGKTSMFSGFGISTLSFKPYQTRVSVDFPNMSNRLLIKDHKTGPYTLGAKDSAKWINERDFPSVPGYKRLGMLNAQADGQTSIIIYPNGYMENTSAGTTTPRTFSITSRWLYENKLVEGTKDQYGRTGLAFQSEADYFLLSRAYDNNLQTFGGWGVEATPLYAVGTVHHIDIWGADYT